MSCIAHSCRIFLGCLLILAALPCFPPVICGADLTTSLTVESARLSLDAETTPAGIVSDDIETIADLEALDAAAIESAALDMSCLINKDAAPDIYSLVDRFFREQSPCLEMSPPDDTFISTLDSGIVVFTPSQYPKAFTGGLIAEMDHECPVYSITLVEDPSQNAVIISNTEGSELAAVKSTPEHDPYFLLNRYFPDIGSGFYNQEEIDGLKAAYSPARIRVVMKLLPADYVDKYAIALIKEEVAANKVAAALGSKLAKGGIVPMMMYQGPAVTNLYISAIELKTNGMLLTLVYPSDFTNRVEIFSCSDLVSYWWNSLAVTNVNTSTNWIEWLDTNALTRTFRIYATGDAERDTDGDGLTDAREKLLYHTSATNSDSDFDGISDSKEVFVTHTDPNNPKTNNPVAFITYPANGSRKVWLP